MKTLLLFFTLIMLIFTINAQDYTFVRGSFNAAGGIMQNSLYSSRLAVAESKQGTSTNTDYTAYTGFLFPQLNQSPPVITSIADVPNDQGLKVQIVWNKCAFDDRYDQDSFYSIWRQDENFDGKSKNQNLEIYTNPFQVIQKIKDNPNKEYFWKNGRDVWTYQDTIPALQYNEYSYIAETLADSSSTGTNEATFKVVFHDDFAYYESESESGYSTDDIAPDRAENITLTMNNSKRGATININWDEVTTGTYAGNTYEEIGGIWYKVYASDTPDFICDESTYLETVTAASYELDATNNSPQFFKIIVSDQP